jgi:hypothetical protein
MKREEAHRLWAPPGAAFTPWVKPVLFAHLDEDREAKAPPAPPAWIEPRLITPLLEAMPPDGREGQSYRTSARIRGVALVLDLPGAEGPPCQRPTAKRRRYSPGERPITR